MTTKEAEAQYLQDYPATMRGKGFAVVNPLNRPEEELPVIYGFNNGGSPEWFDAVLIAEDGECLGGHICSDEAYMPGDLGCLEGTRPDRHEEFLAHYPEGYRMEFVPTEAMNGHVKFNLALAVANAKEV